MVIKIIEYINNFIRIIDRTKRLSKLVYLDCKDVKTLWHVIKELKARSVLALGATDSGKKCGGLKSGTVLAAHEALFPRIELKENNVL